MSNTPNTRTSTRRLNLNYKDPTGGNYDRSKDKKCKYDISGIVQLCNEYKLSKHERNFRTGAEFWRDRDACDRLEHDIGQTESDFIIVALMFTVINPLSLAFKTFKQLKTSPSYKQPLVYTFGDDGIGVSQGEEHMDLEWKGVYRLLMTKYMLAVYTNRMHAFVIPLDQLGDDKGKILASVVNFTAGYKPRVSRSLKRYQSGKGI